jgi:hypothetical protein
MRLVGNGSRIVAGLLSIMASTAAQASLRLIPVYDLGKVYQFDTLGGTINPGLIVGFNPQPDPPGEPTLNIGDHNIKISQPVGGLFSFVIAFTGLPGLLLPAVDQPNADGKTNFTFEYGGNHFNVGLTFAGPGPAGDWTWGAFNPQPDPPGVFDAYAIQFAGLNDPFVTVTLQENGGYLNLVAAPEPSTWAMMLIGFSALGLAGRRAARKRAALDA